jgi:hypothetical protein
MDSRGGGDKLYELMEGEEGDVGEHQREQEQEQEKAGRGGREGHKRRFTGPDLEERMPRSEEEMREEAEILRRELERDGVYSVPPFTPISRAGGEGQDPGDTNSSATGAFSSKDWKTLLTNLAWIATGFGLSSVIMSRRGV